MEFRQALARRERMFVLRAREGDEHALARAVEDGELGDYVYSWALAEAAMAGTEGCVALLLRAGWR